MELRDRLRDWWDRDAATYELSAGHALADPRERNAWLATLARHLPPPPARILDAGAGTGALSLLAAELGHRVTALDFSVAMLERAERKAAQAGLDVRFVVGNVTEPPAGPFDAVIERHVLWTQPDPEATLRAWRGVAPIGRLVMYEALRAPSAARAVRLRLARAARRVLRTAPEHHAEYDPEVLAALPLAGQASF